jgi:hypothetical protein
MQRRKADFKNRNSVEESQAERRRRILLEQKEVR